jgi:hypothetical protein
MVGGIDASKALAAAVADRKLAPELKLRAAAAVLLAGDPADQPAARAALVDGLTAWRHHIRALAISELGRVGGDWAIDSLERLRGRRRGVALQLEIDGAIAAIGSRELE